MNYLIYNFIVICAVIIIYVINRPKCTIYAISITWDNCAIPKIGYVI